jgi:hypothetical protein
MKRRAAPSCGGAYNQADAGGFIKLNARKKRGQ